MCIRDSSKTIDLTENAWKLSFIEDAPKVDETFNPVSYTQLDKMYPLAIFAGKKKVWEGYTYACLGYVHILSLIHISHITTS